MQDDEMLGNEALEAEEFITPASEDDEQSSDSEDLVEESDADAEDDEAEGDEDQEAEDGDDESDDDLTDELEEVEWNGKTYKVHPDLKSGIMMNADYTQKTQALGEERRTLEEQKQTFDQQVESYRALVGDYAEFQALNKQIQQYEGVDWNALEVEDPIEAGRHFRNYQTLKDAAGKVANTIRQKEHQRQLEAQQETAKRDEDYQSALRREVTDWGPELELQLTNFASEFGISDQDMKSVRDVRYIKILKEAMEGRQLKAKLLKQKAAAKKAKPKQDVKPLPKQAKGRTSARSGLSDEQSIEDWVKTRNKQLAARNRR